MAAGIVRQIAVTIPIVDGIGFTDTLVEDATNNNLVHVTGELDFNDNDLFNLYNTLLSTGGYDVTNLPEATP